MDNLEIIYDEIIRIRQLLEFIAREDLTNILEEILTTKERKTIWTLCDGTSGTDIIAKKAGLSQRAVQLVIQKLLDADLITLERRGYPKRKFDHIPSDWRIS